MSEIVQTSDNHEQGNSSLGFVMWRYLSGEFIRDWIKQKKDEKRDREWIEYCDRKEEEANELINELGLVIGKTYKGSFFLGGTHEGKLVEVWNGYACLEFDDGTRIEDIDAYSLVEPDKTPPKSRYVKLSDMV